MKKLFIILLLTACDSKPLPIVKPAIERFKDPICNMWVFKENTYPTVLHDGVLYYFCCNECATMFSKDVDRYAHVCRCKKIRHDCKCAHCSGKQVPCDCEK